MAGLLLSSSTRVHQWLKRTLATLFVLAGLCVTLVYSYQSLHAETIYPAIRVAGIPLGGLTREEAEQVLSKAISVYTGRGMVFVGDGKRVDVSAISSSLSDPDLNYEFIRFDIEKTLDVVWKIGRSGNVVRDARDIVFAARGGMHIPLSVHIDEAYLTALLKENFKDREQPLLETNVVFERGTWRVTQGKEGSVFDYARGMQEFAEQVKVLRIPAIELGLQRFKPRISHAEAYALIPDAEALVARAPLFFVAGDTQYEVTPRDVRQWVRLHKPDTRVEIVFDEDLVSAFLTVKAAELNVPAQNAKFEISDGRVMEFQGSREGTEIDLPASIVLAQEKFLRGTATSSDIVVKTIPAEVTTDNVNTLGIREIVGVGESTFTGSSRNRIKNITVGAAALNGLLIKPGEEFSLVQALGEIDASRGYVQEIVIKGNKTQPEYGGGLCQIGTTLFRSALNSGLPITERQNHSFRVRYYEPAGTDATIYGPHPDLRFVNDSGHYLLLQTRIEGTKAIFELWGTRDGRVTHQTEPKIYNFVKPPPTKLVETTDLAPGQKKCTEKAVTGATTEFDYTVTYTDGRSESRTFKSYYRPWQEVCLVGVEKLTEDPGGATTSMSSSVQ